MTELLVAGREATGDDADSVTNVESYRDDLVAYATWLLWWLDGLAQERRIPRSEGWLGRAAIEDAIDALEDLQGAFAGDGGGFRLAADAVAVSMRGIRSGAESDCQHEDEPGALHHQHCDADELPAPRIAQAAIQCHELLMNVASGEVPPIVAENRAMRAAIWAMREIRDLLPDLLLAQSKLAEIAAVLGGGDAHE